MSKKIAEVDAELAQFKSDSLANQEETTNRLDRMQESIDQHKAESDKQFNQLLQLLQALQPPTTPAPPTTPITTPPITIQIPPLTMSFSVSDSITQPYSVPIQGPPLSTNPSAAYTSFSGLMFDSQGFPLPSWHAGDNGNSTNRNFRPPISSEKNVQNFQTYNNASTGGIFQNSTYTPPFVPVTHMTEHGWSSGSNHRWRKLTMPLFDGTDIYGWVYQAERFFEVQGLTTQGERLRAAVLSLEGPALSWFCWKNNREPFRSWEDLKRLLSRRFQPSQNGNLHEQFFSIQQQGTAREYVTAFEKFAAQLPNLTEEVLEGIFIKGLKPDLRTAVKTQQPASLDAAMDLTLLIDESSSGEASDTHGGTAMKPTANRTVVTSFEPQSATTGAQREKLAVTNKPPLKRLTESELADKRAKGLCFRCDRKFAPGHRCPEQSLHVLLLHEQEEEEAQETKEEDDHPHFD